MASFLKGKGVLEGQEKHILMQQRNTMSVKFTASHSALETGNGASELAKGVEVNGVKVYNMYGIGALDGNAVKTGSNYAYKMGWTSPEKAIDGGAKWISENTLIMRIMPKTIFIRCDGTQLRRERISMQLMSTGL